MEVRPDMAAQWHPAKNGILSPSSICFSSNKKVWWRCTKLHEWEASPNARSKSNCPYCSGKKVCDDNCLATLSPSLAQEWHLTKNAPLTPRQVTLKSNKQVWWLCKSGHEWLAPVCNRSAKKRRGCPVCSGRFVSDLNSLALVNPQLAREWHPTKNGHLTPAAVSIYSDRKVWWRCRRNHEWPSTVANRTGGRGCPSCDNKTSKLQLRVFTEVKSLFPDAEHRKRFGKFECDVFVPSLSAVIEVDGRYWHQNADAKDARKNEFLSKLGYQVFRLREAGLKHLSDTDLCLELNEDEFAICKRLFALIDKRCRISTEARRRIVSYFGRDTFFGDRLFGEMLTSLPSPDEARSLAALRPPVVPLWHPTKNGGLTPRDVWPHSELVVWWQCANGHEWEAPVAGIKTRRACPYCRGHKVCASNCLATRNPKLAKEWHPVKNGLLTPRDVTSGNARRVWWICRKGHEWEYPVGWRNSGDGCPYCAGKRPSRNHCLANSSPEIAAQLHPAKNGKLTAEALTPNSSRKVWWLCRHQHSWEATVYNRVKNRSGCPVCSGNLPSPTNNLAVRHPELAKEWHPTRNMPLTPEQVLPAAALKAWWRCPVGHEWEALVYSRGGGRGCPFCARKKPTPDYNLKRVCPQLACEFHPTLNSPLAPEHLTPGSEQKIWWLCPKGHAWQARVYNRKRGNRCPVCAGRRAVHLT